MMEAEVLKAICSSQGAVNTDYLMFNLGFGDLTNEIIYNQEKFALCCPFGQPKVVARTNLRLCWARECQGSCRELHLCKNILFTGSCQCDRSRGRCNFSHELDSAYNGAILREHGLEHLSRTELCTLLLQSDNTLLPPICYDYNNGDGEFGLCQRGYGCKRLHICEKHLNHDCRCTKSHDFNAPQPLKSLRERNVPDNIIRSLKSVYANISALRFYDRSGDRGHSAAASNTDASSDYGRGRGGNRGNRGYRGNRGNRGNRGYQGNLQQQQQTCSRSDIVAAFNDSFGPNRGIGDQQQLNSSTSDVSVSAYDSDANSSNSQNRKQARDPSKASTAGRGRGGNRGNHQQLQRARSTHDIFAAVNNDANSDDGPNRRERKRPVKGKTEICMYFIKGHCKHEERCFKAHDKMPYRWQIKQDDKWTALPANETIEKDYCDPKNTYSGRSPPVHFDTMTCGPNEVRRLSTINSLSEPTFIHTTEWVWYWEDESGEWNMYASATASHRPADMSSTELEQKFLENDKDVVEFTAGPQSYSLSFPDMMQTNKNYGTKRLVRRRPRFVSAADVQTKRVRRPLGQPSFSAIPDHWDKTHIPQTGYRRVSLQHSSDEFKEVEALFCKTIRGFDIVKIERIQNKALWEVFQWQKNQMKNYNGVRYVAERKLFHGTDSKHVDVICHTNFDWRICGTHGTAFGKGSYFARDAKYSHSYTGDPDVKSMFVARVLVGDYTKGSSDLRRPPSKDGGDINFFDSCVDDVTNPSIFVVFEKHQIYPEYLLQYKTSHPPVASVPAPIPVPVQRAVPAPRPAPQPSRPVPQPSRPAPQPSAPFYQPSTASYQPSTLSYNSSTTSYQYQPSRAVYQPMQPSPSSPPIAKEKKHSDSCVIA